MKSRRATPKKGARVASSRIADALRKSGGVVTDAAKTLGVARATLTRRLSAEPALREARDEMREEYLDLAESRLLERIKAGELNAVIFYLRTQGRGRGYVERSEHGGVPDAPPIRFYVPAKAPLPPDDEPLATMPADDTRRATAPKESPNA